MSHQMQLVFSSEIAGTGLCAGGIFYSAAAGAVGTPLPEGYENEEDLEDYILEVTVPKVGELYAAGKIDNPDNLADSPVYLTAGDLDALVPPILP